MINYNWSQYIVINQDTFLNMVRVLLVYFTNRHKIPAGLSLTLVLFVTNQNNGIIYIEKKENIKDTSKL